MGKDPGDILVKAVSFLLAVESATKFLSTALFDYGKKTLIGEISCQSDGRSHSEKLLPLVDRIIRENGITLENIKAIAVSTGPGSYTALRVGIATVMGLSAGRSMAIFPVSTLKTMAVGVGEESALVAPVLPAGRGRVYTAVYRSNSSKGVLLAPEIAETSLLPEDFISLMRSFKRKVFIVGLGLEFARGIKEAVYNDAVFPNARNAGFLALKGDIPAVSAKDLKITYLQEPDFGAARSPLTLPQNH